MGGGWLLVAAQNHGGVNLAIAVLHTTTLVADGVGCSDVLSRHGLHDETLTLPVDNTVDNLGRSDGGLGLAAIAHVRQFNRTT